MRNAADAISVSSGLETGDSFAVIPKHDAFDVVESRVEPIERCMDTIERAGYPERLQARERRKGGHDRRCLRPLHVRIVPARVRLGKMAEYAMPKCCVGR